MTTQIVQPAGGLARRARRQQIAGEILRLSARTAELEAAVASPLRGPEWERANADLHAVLQRRTDLLVELTYYLKPGSLGAVMAADLAVELQRRVDEWVRVRRIIAEYDATPVSVVELHVGGSR